MALLPGMAVLAGADSEQDALEACRSISEDARRLACYDGIPVPPTAPRPSAVAETAVTPAPPVAPTPAGAAEDANVVQRGLGRLRGLFGRDEPRPEKPPELQSIDAQVVEVVKLARGNHRLTLEDGQVWREIEVKPRARYRVGDNVEIARGALGSYNLSNERTGHRIKVRRVR
ncbi:MAG: hypothetical protein OXM56_09900 [Gammaproteobacteria bacterium]|nr:hypothetical protein [Gammaproteobacteria bacterium]